MKYIMTVVFDSSNQEKATLAFQNAACLVNGGDGCEPLEIAHLKEVLNGNTERPTLETVQVLRPEDFSTWLEGTSKPATKASVETPLYLQDDSELFAWLQNLSRRGAGHFLTAIGVAAFQADCDNVKVLYPVLKQLQAKYPQYN